MEFCEASDQLRYLEARRAEATSLEDREFWSDLIEDQRRRMLEAVHGPQQEEQGE